MRRRCRRQEGASQVAEQQSMKKKTKQKKNKTYVEDIMSSSNTVHRGRVNHLLLGLELLRGLGRRLVSSGRQQTTLKKTAGDVAGSDSLLDRLGRLLLTEVRAVEESVVHGGRLEFLLDLLDVLGVSLEDGLLADEGRVGWVGHLHDARIDLLNRAAFVAEGNGNGFAGLDRSGLLLGGGRKAIGGVGVGGSTNVDNVGGHTELVVSRRGSILLGQRGRNLLALRSKNIRKGALEREVLLLGRSGGLDRRLRRLAVALVGKSASSGLLGRGWLSRHPVASAGRMKSGRVFQGRKRRRRGCGMLVQEGCVLRRQRSAVDDFAVRRGRGDGFSCLGRGEQTGEFERSAVSE
jgi:hypothetical protein